jgi:hypothetical protein
LTTCLELNKTKQKNPTTKLELLIKQKLHTGTVDQGWLWNLPLRDSLKQDKQAVIVFFKTRKLYVPS